MEANYFSLREFGGTEELDLKLSDNINFTGDNFFARLKMNDLTCGQATFTQPPSTLEHPVDIPREELVTKEYVDSIQTNGGRNYYFNYSQTDPVYTLFKELSSTVEITAQQNISTLALGTNLLAQFISPVLNLSRLQSGLFTLNQRLKGQSSFTFKFTSH